MKLWMEDHKVVVRRKANVSGKCVCKCGSFAHALLGLLISYYIAGCETIYRMTSRAETRAEKVAANDASTKHRDYIKQLRAEVAEAKSDSWNGRIRMLEIDGADSNAMYCPIDWRTQQYSAVSKGSYMKQKVMTVLEHGQLVKVTMYVFDPQVNIFEMISIAGPYQHVYLCCRHPQELIWW